MNNEHTHMDDLLVKYLLGEADDQERRQLEEWLQRHEDNRRYFSQFRLIWEQSKELAGKSMVSESAAWERFRQRVEPGNTTTVPKKTVQPFSRYLQVAAVMALLISTGLFFYLNRVPEMQVLQASAGPVTATLPDGSVVTLNTHSVLRYPGVFRGRLREVSLEGEAFFTISPDKTKPFIIDADEVAVKVVGTSFNVKSNEGRTEVIVETGIVEVRKEREAVTLQAQEKAVAEKDSKTLVKERNPDVLYNYYRTNEFICDNTPLWRLTEILEEAFRVKIIIADPAKRDLPLSTHFRNEQLDHILSVICATFELQARREGSQIILE